MMRAEYKRLLTQAYDLDKPEAPPEELAAHLREIRAHAVDGPVLEAMCGSGRFLVPIAEAGYDVDGVDASSDMLAACSFRIRSRGLHANLYEQWLHELHLPRRYGFVLLVAGSMGLVIDDDEVRDTLLLLRAHMLPGAPLLVEIQPPYERRGDGLWRGRWWQRPDGATIVLRNISRYDDATTVEEGLGIYELWRDGELIETEMDDWSCRFWQPDEFAALLTEAGFERVTVVAPGRPGITTFRADAPR
jgi:SAM-dependent methyltransferase